MCVVIMCTQMINGAYTTYVDTHANTHNNTRVYVHMCVCLCVCVCVCVPAAVLVDAGDFSSLV